MLRLPEYRDRVESDRQIEFSSAGHNGRVAWQTEKIPDPADLLSAQASLSSPFGPRFLP